MFRLNIREIRLSKNISQKELAKKGGISQSYISMLEKGDIYQITPTLDVVEAIANALGVCSKDILIVECDFCKNYINKKCKFNDVKKED